MTFIYNSPIKLNIPQIPFRSIQNTAKVNKDVLKDGFVTNPFERRFETKEQIELRAKTNPKIVSILREYNLPLKVNIEELEKLKQGHLKDTRVMVAKIYSSLPAELKKEIDISKLQEAAMLHDYGKVLIPSSILNKSGKLTPEEKEIMQLHPIMGYELLKDTDIDKDVLNLIKYHHQNLKNTGYPKNIDGFDYNLEAQIITTADKYSALREKRSYKNPLAKYEALEIIAKDVNDGNISQDVYTALTKII